MLNQSYSHTIASSSPGELWRHQVSKFQGYWRDLARLNKQSLAWRDTMSPGDIKL
ncbi:hypothetical protein A2U01_0083624, partial [Trifolium medium]|nr:hypothetical protein [Trifolium medium]